MKEILILLVAFIISMNCLYATPTDAQIQQAANTLGVPFENLKQFVLSHQTDNSNITPQNFMDIFISAFNAGNFDKMLSMTSDESIGEYGRDKILEYYKDELIFGYEMKYTGFYRDGNFTIIRCDAIVWGTSISCKIMTIQKNGELKLVLRSLDATWGRGIQEGV